MRGRQAESVSGNVGGRGQVRCWITSARCIESTAADDDTVTASTAAASVTTTTTSTSIACVASILVQ